MTSSQKYQGSAKTSRKQRSASKPTSASATKSSKPEEKKNSTATHDEKPIDNKQATRLRKSSAPNSERQRRVLVDHISQIEVILRNRENAPASGMAARRTSSTVREGNVPLMPASRPEHVVPQVSNHWPSLAGHSAVATEPWPPFTHPRMLKPIHFHDDLAPFMPLMWNVLRSPGTARSLLGPLNHSGWNWQLACFPGARTLVLRFGNNQLGPEAWGPIVVPHAREGERVTVLALLRALHEYFSRSIFQDELDDMPILDRNLVMASRFRRTKGDSTSPPVRADVLNGCLTFNGLTDLRWICDEVVGADLQLTNRS